MVDFERLYWMIEFATKRICLLSLDMEIISEK